MSYVFRLPYKPPDQWYLSPQRASPKGLVCGSGLVICLANGEKIEVNDTEGSLIPAGEDIESFEVGEVSWVLIVEKEVSAFPVYASIQYDNRPYQAIFQTLCRLKVAETERMPGKGLIITVCP